MLKNLSVKLVNDAVQKGYVKIEDVDDYIYGISSFINTFINILAALILGIITHMLFEIILFLIVFQTLRKFVGGSHSKTHIRCYVSTFFTYIVVLWMIKNINVSSHIVLLCMAAACITMLILAPVEAIKKPLDTKEKQLFGFVGRLIVVFWFIIYIVLQYFMLNSTMQYCAKIIAITSITVAIFAITGEFKLIRYKKNKTL